MQYRPKFSEKEVLKKAVSMTVAELDHPMNIINCKLSFCHITLASKIFSRNNYFPLFRVMTPKDARRRLLRKLQGPMEHYIPVLMNHKRREKLSKGKRVKLAPGYGKRPHTVDEELRYVNVSFDPDNDKHRRCQALIKTKRRLKGKFVYSVYERDTVLVCPGQMEDAIRDGDIADVMISDFSDKVIIRYKTGDKIIVAIDDWDGKMEFLEGEGYTTKAIEDKHHYGKSTMGLAQIYEMKEKGMDDGELERLRSQASRKAKAQIDIDADVVVKKEMKVVLDNLDYADDFDDYEEELNKMKKKMEEQRKAALAELDEDERGTSSGEGESSGEGDKSEEGSQIDAPTCAMSLGDQTKTTNVTGKLVDAGLEILGKLPNINEINEVVRQLEQGHATEMAEVCGIAVQVGDKEKFLIGQMVHTESGDTFVPGQTIETPEGTTSYMPGVTVNIDDTPTFIAGLIMANEENQAVFLPGQSVITEDGQLKLAEEGEHILPTGMSQMDVELDVNDVTEEDEERKIAKRMAEEEAKKEREDKERADEEKKKRAAEKKAKDEAARKKKDEEDKAWAKLGAVERAKKERLRIEREKREAEKQRKEDMERDRIEKERQEQEREERAKMRAEREEVERLRMEKVREKKKRAREEARMRAEKAEAEKKKAEEAKAEVKRQKEAAAKAIRDAEEAERLAKLAEFIPVEIPRKEIVVDEEKEAETLNMKKNFAQEEMKRMQRLREVKIKPIKKFVIPVIEKYVPLPPVVISEKLKEMEELIQSGEFFIDHKKFMPNMVQRLMVRFYTGFQEKHKYEFRALKRKYMIR